MPYPKLAGTSNNCALHALTPELCAEIQKFAEQPHYDNQHNPEYFRLKAVFAQFYKLNEDEFTWGAFHAVLTQYNPFDVQIILGPVLRSFMKGVMVKTSPEDPEAKAYHEWVKFIATVDEVTPDELIQQYTMRSDRDGLAGRYYSLTDEELAILVGWPLGLGIMAYPQEGAPHSFPVEDNQVALVEIFHTGGTVQDRHWERAAQGAGCEDYRDNDTTKLTFILPFFDETVFLSTYGTHLLKKYVQSAMLIDNDKLQELQLTSQQIQTYFSLVKSVPSEFAIKALPKPLTNVTEHFIRRYTFAPVAAGQVVETLFSVPSAHKFSASVAQQQAFGYVKAMLSEDAQKQLKTKRHYLAICNKARETATDAVELIKARRVIFAACNEIADVDSLLDGLTRDLRQTIERVTEDLGHLVHNIADFPQIQAAVDTKLEDIQQAALGRKRQIILVKLTMDAHVRNFEAKTRKMETDATTKASYTKAAEVARVFVTAINAAKTAFEQDGQPLDDAKKDFKKACEDAVKAARPVLNHHIEWKGAIAKFLIDIASYMARGIYDVDKRWGVFAKTDYQIVLDEFDTGVIKNALIQVP